MENASKALIIAGSVLIALIIISLAVMTFNRFGGSAKEMADLDQQEIDSFNAKITPYIGKNVSGTQVRALIQLVRSIDQNAVNTGNVVKRVSVYLNGDSGGTIVQLLEGDDTVTYNGMQSIITNRRYTVEREFGKSGLIDKIYITLNGSSYTNPSQNATPNPTPNSNQPGGNNRTPTIDIIRPSPDAEIPRLPSNEVDR